MKMQLHSNAVTKITYDIRKYRQISIIRHNVGNKIVDKSDVVGAAPVGTVPSTFSFST